MEFANNKQLENININNLKNIEEGLGHKLEYIESCNNGIGYAQEKANMNEHPKKIGSRLIALNNSWIIKEIFTEKLITPTYDKCYMLHKLWFKNSFVYKVENHLGTRIIRVTQKGIEVFYDNGDYSGYNNERPNDFFVQHGCFLEKIL